MNRVDGKRAKMREGKMKEREFAWMRERKRKCPSIRSTKIESNTGGTNGKNKGLISWGCTLWENGGKKGQNPHKKEKKLV